MNSCISMQEHKLLGFFPFFLFIILDFFWTQNSLFTQDVNYYYNESSQKDRNLEMISPLSSRRLFGSCCFENLLPPMQATLWRESCLNILAIREGPHINYGYRNSEDILTNKILWNPLFSATIWCQQNATLFLLGSSSSLKSKQDGVFLVSTESALIMLKK